MTDCCSGRTVPRFRLSTLFLVITFSLAASRAAAFDAAWTAPFIATGAVWKYLDNGSNQGTNWYTVNFDDSAWDSGPAQLGYGDGDEATVVSFGPYSWNKYVTTYFRRRFVLTNAAAFSGITLGLLSDDGAVVYVNGAEAYRSNMRPGAVTYTTLAITNLNGTAETIFVQAPLKAGYLREGTNTVAVEIHQVSLGNIDISFDMYLTGSRAPTPRASFQASSSAGRFALQTSNTNMGGLVSSNFAGCCHATNTGELLVIADNPATIQFYDRNGNYLDRSVTLTGFSDPEDICVYDPDAGLYAIVEEGSNVITVVAIATNTVTLDKTADAVASIPMGLSFADPELGIEGIAYDPRRDCWYAVQEKSPMRVIRVTGTGATTNLFNAQTAFTNRCTNLSDIFYDPYSDRLFVVSSESRRIIECTLAGSVVAMKDLDSAAPEGMALSGNGSEVFVVGQPDEFHRYEAAPQAGQCGQVIAVNLPVSLSWTCAQTATVSFAITSETAVAGVDYSPASGLLTFGPGVSQRTLSFSTLNNPLQTNNHALVITLTNAAGFVLGRDSLYTWAIVTNRPILEVASARGGAVPSVGSHFYVVGSPVACYVTNSPLYEGVLATQYVCSGWAGSGSVPATGSGTNAGTITVTNDSYIGWRWQTNCWLAYEADVGGSVLFGNKWVQKGTTTRVEAVVLNGYHFSGWSGDTGAADTNSRVINLSVDRPLRVAAHFEANLDANGALPIPTVELASTSSIDRFKQVYANINMAGYSQDNFSGCCFMPSTGELLVNLNRTTNGTFGPAILVYTTNGVYQRYIILAGFDDVEGICQYKTASNLYAVVEEGINDITIVTITPATTNINKSSGNIIDMGLPFGAGYNSGIEGIVYDPTNDCFYAVKEQFPMAVYRVSTNDAIVSRELFNTEEVFAGLCTDLADLCYDPATGHLLIQSHESFCAFECELDGTILGTVPTPANQPEGITLSADRSHLYVVGEPNEFYHYVLSPQTMTRKEGTVADFPVTLSWPWTNTVTVDFAVTSSTAVAGVDYSPSNGTLTFVAGSTSEHVLVNILMDPGIEGAETIVASLGNPVNALPGRESAYACVIPANTAMTFVVSCGVGNASPPAGTNCFEYATVLSASVTESPFYEGTLATQHVCSGWSGAGFAPASGPGTNTGPFLLTNNASITWNWSSNFWLATGTNGSGSVAGGNVWVPALAETQLTASADLFYQFGEWSGDVPPEAVSSNPLPVMMDRPRTVVAGFPANLATNDTPQWWLARHYPEGTNDFDAAALADSDVDLAPAWAEYRAGTDPTNGLSVFKIVQADCLNPSNTVFWLSVTNRSYAVYYSTNIAGQWEEPPLASNVAGEVTGTNSFEEPARSDPAVFYKVKVE